MPSHFSCWSVRNLLMRDKNFPASDDLRKGDTAVLLPVLHSLRVVHEDNEVIVLALVVDLGLGTVSTRHDDRLEGFLSFGYGFK